MAHSQHLGNDTRDLRQLKATLSLCYPSNADKYSGRTFHCDSGPDLDRFLRLLHVLYSQAVWGTKELILLSKRMKSINTKLCSYAGLDQLCAQLSYTITGFNQKNLNLVGGFFILTCIFCVKGRNLQELVVLFKTNNMGSEAEQPFDTVLHLP